jgi:hypothetical protein
LIIFDIALGIVLAYMILRFLPLIVAVGSLAVVTFIFALITVAFIQLGSELRNRIFLILLIVAVSVGCTFALRFISKYTAVPPDLAGGLFLVLLLFLPVTIGFFWFAYRWVQESGEVLPILFLFPLLGLWYWFWTKLRKSLEIHREKVYDTNKKS